ncbi:MAG: peptidoglycan-associated lipoprotein Pal [Xanthomonadaceae bacterium]|nr:peptidoglycan-associated lipoprotein Pal [Xanthomonadaceae bacterium]
MKHLKMAVLLILLASVAVMFSACATCKTKKVEEEKVSQPAAMTEPAKIISEKPAVSEGDLSTEQILAVGDRLDPVYFDFDKYNLKDLSRNQLAKNAQWMKDNPGAVVRIEGNCDERGSNEYNLALGERRASSAKKYLVYQGISPNQLETISYGEEKSTCDGHYEGCWWKNRRDDFVIVKK